LNVQGIGLQIGAGEIQHIGGVEGVAAGVLEDLPGIQFVQVAAVLRLARFLQVDGNICGNLFLGCQLQGNAHA